MAVDPNDGTSHGIPPGENVAPLNPGAGGSVTPDPTQPAASGPPPPMSATDASAQAQITGFLGTYGLGDLGSWAWGKWQNGESIDQIMLELRSTPQYKARFPAMDELSRQGRAISEGDYIGYETTIHQLVRNAGLVGGMYDTPEGIAKLLVSGVSPAEAKSRLDVAQYAAFQAPQQVRDAFTSYYGVPASDGDLTSYYLDDTRALPLLQQQANAAAIGGAGRQEGVDVDRVTAEGLAAQGVSYAQALQGLGAVGQTQALGSGPGEQASQGTRIGAQFGDQAAQAAVARVIKGRLAQTQGGGGAAAVQGGVVGLGSGGRQP